MKLFGGHVLHADVLTFPDGRCDIFCVFYKEQRGFSAIVAEVLSARHFEENANMCYYVLSLHVVHVTRFCRQYSWLIDTCLLSKPCRSKGCGIVEFSTVHEAQTAIERLVRRISMSNE